MDQKRLLAAIAISIGILLVFDVYNRANAPPPVPVTAQAPAAGAPVPAASPGAGTAPGETAASAAPETTPATRVPVANDRISGSLSARGLQLDMLTLLDYRETVQPNSAQVRLLNPRGRNDGYFAQWGWTAADNRTRVPDNNSDWTVTGGPLRPGVAADGAACAAAVPGSAGTPGVEGVAP